MDLERWMCSPPTKTGGWPPSEGGCNETTANTGKPVFVLFSSLSLHHRCLHFTVTITSENSNLKPSSLLSKVVPDALPAPCLYPALAWSFRQLLQDRPRPDLPVASLPVWRLLTGPLAPVGGSPVFRRGLWPFMGTLPHPGCQVPLRRAESPLS